MRTTFYLIYKYQHQIIIIVQKPKNKFQENKFKHVHPNTKSSNCLAILISKNPSQFKYSFHKSIECCLGQNVTNLILQQRINKQFKFCLSMENTSTQNTPMLTTEATKPQQSQLQTTEQQNKPNAYYFQTQTKRLKTYYLNHQTSLIGRKILFNNSSGIVRYFGPLLHNVPNVSKQELWIGIEWDEFGRGKHNGTVSGYKYFECEQNQGSMIKYQKIQFGYRLETALFKRYFKAQQLHQAKDIFENLKEIKEQLKNSSSADKTVNSSSADKTARVGQAITKKVHKIEYDAQAYFQTVKKTKKIVIEFVGFDQIWTKINNLDKIQSISLAECRICDLGPVGHLNGLLKNLKILSLEENLLSDWNQVYQLGYQLPELAQLSVSSNHLHPPSTPFQDLKQIEIEGRDEKISLEGVELFRNLRSLILIKTGLTWKSFFKVVAAFKKVNDFILCKNDLSDTQNIDTEKLKYLGQTKFLNLEQTNQTSFEKLHIFSQLPKIQKLTLNKNQLKQLSRKTAGFASLKHLSVQNCGFEKPVVLYEISLFKNLESLNVKHNTIGDKYGNTYVRMRAVAEIKKLTQINGAQLKKYERKDCEIFYLRQSFREYFAYKKVPDYDYDFQDFMKYCQIHHPNINVLMKIYGNPYEVEKKKEIQAIIKQEVKVTEIKKGTGMVQITIEYNFQNSYSIDTKKMPLSWTISSLKNFFAKTLKVSVGLLKLTSHSFEKQAGQEMTEDHKTLSFYNLRSGSKIVVEKRPA